MSTAVQIRLRNELQLFDRLRARPEVDVERLAATLPERTADTRARASRAQCLQVLRDLCLMARADDKGAAERAVLHRIAVGLGLGDAYVVQCLASSGDLD